MKNKVISREYVDKNYISIKELKKVLDIEEYDNIDVLSHISTLMSEVDRLEDIEDRKVQIEYQLVFNEGVKSVEDKIKEKIKELESHIWKDGYMTKFDKYAIYYLKELLGGTNGKD